MQFLSVQIFLKNQNFNTIPESQNKKIKILNVKQSIQNFDFINAKKNPDMRGYVVK